MKKRIIVWELLFWVIAFIFATTVHGQNAPPPPATFTFGPTTTCSPILSWNGVDNAYPEDMGAICPYQGNPTGGYGSFLEVPWQLGFLDNGLLQGCDPMVWGQKTFAQRPDGTTGDGTQAGDTFTQPAATTCPYYTGEYGGAIPDNFLPQFSIVANFTVEKIISCGRYGCRSHLKTSLTGGTGVVEEAVVQ